MDKKTTSLDNVKAVEETVDKEKEVDRGRSF